MQWFCETPLYLAPLHSTTTLHHSTPLPCTTPSTLYHLHHYPNHYTSPHTAWIYIDNSLEAGVSTALGNNTDSSIVTLPHPGLVVLPGQVVNLGSSHAGDIHARAWGYLEDDQ